MRGNCQSQLLSPHSSREQSCFNGPLRGDETLPEYERADRRDGRVASLAGAACSAAGGVAAIAAMGATEGLCAAGITRGLASIGAIAGGGMVAAATVVADAPVVSAAGLVTGAYVLSAGVTLGCARRHVKGAKSAVAEFAICSAYRRTRRVSQKLQPSSRSGCH